MTFESYCEGDQLIAFDYDLDGAGFAAQPFEFAFTTTGDRRESTHGTFFGHGARWRCDCRR